MTVREVIEHLKTLEQDKGIWVNYDCIHLFPPINDNVADQWYAENFDGVKEGDYIIDAY